VYCAGEYAATSITARWFARAADMVLEFERTGAARILLDLHTSENSLYVDNVPSNYHRAMQCIAYMQEQGHRPVRMLFY
jgi:hypothetical protein